MFVSRPLLAVASAAALSSAATADVLFVDDDAPLGGDGLTWDTAYRFLQDALHVAAGDQSITEIRVAQGSHRPDLDEAGNVTPGDRVATFQLLNDVALMGGYAGLGRPDPGERDIDLYETRLSGDLLGDDGPDFQGNDENSYHVVTASSVDDTALVEGFTISGGNTDDHGSGGGLRSVKSDVTVSRCRFARNRSLERGGAAYVQSSAPVLQDCIFEENLAHQGAGLYTWLASPTVIRCRFSNNRATISGAGAYNERSSPWFSQCQFIENEARGGGGIYNFDSPAIIANCRFHANRGDDGYSEGGGGGIYNSSSSPLIINCIFTDNLGRVVGGAINNLSSPSKPAIVNCTFSGNIALELGGGAVFSEQGSESVLRNCVLWGDSPDEIVDYTNALTTVSNSDVEGGWPGAGLNNIDLDPLFVDPDNGDFRLTPGSPCIDAGHNWAIAGLADTDLDGNPRFADGPAVDTGCGIPVVVDMGTYEYQGDPFPVKLGDIDGDAVVGIIDFLKLLARWGPCPEDCCLADLDLNGDVGVNDFLILLANWTPA
jgi:hypothetical protein